MWYALAAVVVVAVLLLLLRRRRGAAPSVAMFAAIEDGLRASQQHAAKNILPGGISGFDEETMRGRTFVALDAIRFIYTVERHDDGYVHAVSSRLLRPKGREFQIQCMLIVMLIWNRQLGAAGIKQEAVRFEVQESELGTHFVEMFLEAAQHDGLLAVAS